MGTVIITSATTIVSQHIEFTITAILKTKGRLYQLLKGIYDIYNEFFTLSNLTATRGHTKKLFDPILM